MTSHEIRRHFLDFFQSKQHLIVASAPLVAKNDPTLMFNNSGMAQFKDFFLGNGNPPSRRVADTQKCLRVSGKHNDLEDVGFDTYHHTMFEMLGNWSFGDYFKKEAITWAWELLTEVYKLPKDRLYVSVFEGDQKDNVPFDQEAFDLWEPIVGKDRIIYGNKKDNFWEMGDTGPCGPCSEIHVDLRSPEEVAQTPGKDLVNADHPQVVEIWNLVFMQFNRKADGSLEPLPARHVDTGMGFERLCMAIQGKKSNYDTDVFTGTIGVIEEVSGMTYGGTMDKADVTMRVIADHIRAVSFAIGDGLVPSNAKAGYVIRRILRRAIRYGYSYLNLTEPFMTKLVPTLAAQFADVFPELNAQRDFVATVIREEEISFLRTLGTGLGRLDQIIADLSGRQESVIPGETVFELNDTFGFPADLTALIAREKGLSIDDAGFQKALQEQKARSRKDASSSAGDWIDVNEVDGTRFVGYDQTEADTFIVKYRKVQNKQGTQYQIVLAETPFYAESGGQIGDTGVLVLTTGEQVRMIRIVDTKKENDLSILIAADKDLDDLLESATSAHAVVDADRRMLTSSNHSATHLLHAALRDVLGTHVAQKGSYVGPDALRFDFSHFSKVTDEQLAQVERIVNEKIRQDIPLDEKRNVPIVQAKELGATALFGEKYGDFVRVITFDPAYSVELCGGTHVPATGHIGLFKFTGEGSVSTGIRRIEAKTSVGAEALVNEQMAVISELKELLKAPKDIVKAVQSLIDERIALQKQVDAMQNEKVQQLKNELLTKIQPVNGHMVLVERVDVPNAEALKQLAYDLKAKVDNLALVLGADINGKPQLAVMLPDSLIQDKHMNAGQVVKELAKNIKGGGGGQPFFATAGGSESSGLDAALAQGKALLG
ncbi:alanine--tRNA ligase [Spirosoma utsteinense]|uniref:Alanine--tRNA ligase n=1 Tax=Spirosoma utsteinense TaxID=2585773 RepID=A0ABR6W4G8_9BACT|nr:alanine--tRNA ligase [Spirosoma utsteinense]MBC3785160.1 alanyl-tRNA synthetase [Spirosoma utsteinense]MBC3790615.1 alanyl-tRNA synthetase [Spirosoma utsteinense]